MNPFFLNNETFSNCSSSTKLVINKKLHDFHYIFEFILIWQTFENLNKCISEAVRMLFSWFDWFPKLIPTGLYPTLSTYGNQNMITLHLKYSTHKIQLL